MNKEDIDLKDKRISLLTETLASRDKSIEIRDQQIEMKDRIKDKLKQDIETLKAEINRLNNELLQNDTVILKDLESRILHLQKVVKTMAEWISKQDLDFWEENDANFIVNYFESEVKE